MRSLISDQRLSPASCGTAEHRLKIVTTIRDRATTKTICVGAAETSTL